MDEQYDFSRLEGNLYLSLLGVFSSTTGIELNEADADRSKWMGRVLNTAETLSIGWLRAGLPRTVDVLLEHVWPTICSLATLTGEDADAYEDDDSHFHEVLGLTDELDKEPEGWMTLMGLSSCAKALAATDADSSFFYALHASKCEGMVFGAHWVRGEFSETKLDRERLAHAGRISGAVRRERAKASPETVLEMERRLLLDGKGVRDTAAIIAERLGVTSEYVRQLRRRKQK